MKLVFVAYDNISHQPKSTNLLSKTNDINFYVKDCFVDNIQKLNEIYDNYKPDVFFIDTEFKKKDMKNFLLNFQRKNDNGCKIIMTIKDKKDRNEYAKTRVPARFFPYRVASDILSYSFTEMIEGQIFSYNKNIPNLINDFKLDLSSPVTRQFENCLEILTSKPSRYLLYGYLYDVFYTVSIREDVSLDTIRKSVYKVKQNIDANISPTLRHSIFKDNNLFDMHLTELFEYIVEYIEGKN